MPQDRLRELLDLSAIHGFYVGIIEQQLGHPVPPHELKPEDYAALAMNIHQWLDVLDLAIQPGMVRDALQQQPPREALEALLRMYILRASEREGDRDKADFIATYLYRNPPRWRSGGRPANADQGDLKHVADFEQEMWIILDAELPAIPPQHQQLLRELDIMQEEVEDFREFDQLTDANLLPRLRDLKTSLQASFYHPSVLARVAGFNAWFGRRFDELFRSATQQIKTYAASITEQGGSIMSRVEGEVTVKNLAEVEEHAILKQEYGRAREQFRRISNYKKVVASKAGRAGTIRLVGPKAAGGAVPAKPVPAIPRAALDLEEAHLRGVVESIQSFVRAAEANAAHVVPLRNINIGLVPHEAEAFRADFRGEKSFRADLAASLMRMVAIGARMKMEILELQGKQQSAYLWKPHADALTALLQTAEQTLALAASLTRTAQQRGLKDKVGALATSEQRLRVQMQETARTLAMLK